MLGRADRAFAEEVVARADAFALVPPGLDLRDAAALPLVGLTGAQLIEEAVKPKQGDIVLVTGALGAVGRVAIYAAKKLGVRTIAGVRRKQTGAAAELGASQVVAIDDDTEIGRLPRLDAIADTVGGEVTARLLPHLRKGGVVGSVLVSVAVLVTSKRLSAPTALCVSLRKGNVAQRMPLDEPPVARY